VLDIGAGTGALTGPLVRAGARVVAVELHPRRADELARRFGASRVTVVRADVTELRLPRRPFKVVANPPFAATTAVLKRLLAAHSRLVRADVVVPLHVARRWTEGRAPGANRWRLDYDAWITRTLPRHAFSPPCPGPVAVLTIARRAHAARPRVGRRKREGRPH
jgi:23S rRNA (adenine-N6)-dimethyltransferase